MRINTIFSKLLISFLPLIIVALITSSWLNYRSAKKVISDEVVANLTVIAERNIHIGSLYVQERRNDLRALASMPTSNHVFEILSKKNISAKSPKSLLVKNSAAYENISALFKNIYFDDNYKEVYLIAANGTILHTIHGSDAIGINLFTDPSYRDTGLANIAQRSLTITDTQHSLAAPFPGITTQLSVFMSTPIIHGGVAIGILAARLNRDNLIALSQDRHGLGRTGEILVIQKQEDMGKYLSPLRYKDLALQQPAAPIDSFSMPVQWALAEQSGSGIQLDYRGEETISIWRFLTDLNRAVIVKMDTSEAFASIDALQKTVMVAIGAAILLCILTAYALAAKIATPIRNLTAVAQQYSDGDLNVRATLGSEDEVGTLARTFNTMIAHQSQQHAEIINQMTSLEQQAQDLRRSNSELDSFSYIASHDLKSPLRGIDNLASWIQEDIDSDSLAEIPKHIALLRQRIKRMEGLLDDLLEYSRLGRIENKIKSVACAELVQELFDCANIDGSFQLTISGHVPVFDTLASPFTTILRNLIGNAIKHHSRGNGVIGVDFSARNDMYLITVSDDGDGIEPQFHQRIFGMFQTLKSRDEMEGSGIGLAIVKKIIELNGGTITLASEPGQGSHFTFSWPKQIFTKDT